MIRLYRDSLQWSLYGANSSRTQAHGEIELTASSPAIVGDGLVVHLHGYSRVWAVEPKA